MKKVCDRAKNVRASLIPVQDYLTPAYTTCIQYIPKKCLVEGECVELGKDPDTVGVRSIF